MRCCSFPKRSGKGTRSILDGRLALFVVASLTVIPARAGEFEFVVIGDTRPRFESQDFRPFEGLIAKINALKPALVINLGDLIYGYGPRSKEKQAEAIVPGVASACRTADGRTSFAIAIPLRLLKHPRIGAESHLILDLSFPVPDAGVDATEPADPSANTFAYRVRYGNDSLIPVQFIELNLERK